MQALQRGDQDALRVIVEAYTPRALRIAVLITGDPHWAEDAVAEAFFRLWRHAATYDSHRPFLPWFDGIVVHCAITVSRSAGRDVMAGQRGAARSHQTPAPIDVQGEVEGRDLARCVASAVHALPQAQRLAVVLKYVLDMSDSDIAAVSGWPLGTAKWRLAAARRTLRKALGPVIALRRDAGDGRYRSWGFNGDGARTTSI